uniref:CCHC-type domain-containing protein n=1 Tax=Tanacetum cinerariifolium TaxID=118510 RepID=A0A6L2MHJ1_TANCI|nr:hypothetical protein [Tanacetum cinerariifolium]
MESLSPQVVFAAKLLVLNPNEFDLWKMRIEQYFLMTDYSLWEVILNRDSPAPIRVIKGVLQPVAPITAEQRLATKNELKARGTLLMALPDIYQLKFNTHKDAKILMEAIEKKVCTNEPVSDVASVSAVSEKIHVSAIPNIDADDLEEMDLKWQMAMLIVRARRFLQTTGRNLEANRPTSMGFDMSKVECYNCHRKGNFARECRSPKDTRTNGAAEPQKRNEEPTNYTLMAFSSSSSSSDSEVVSCSKACTKAYANLQSQYDKLTDDYRKSQFDVISYKTGLESVEARLLVYQQNESVFEEDIKLLKFKVQLRDNALVFLRQNLEKAKQERDDLKLKLEKFQTSSKNLSELLASQTNDKTGLGYNSQVFTRAMFDCDNYLTSGSDESLPPSPIYIAEQVKSLTPSVKHVETSIPAANPMTACPKPKSQENSKNRKACFVCKSLTNLIKDCDYHEKTMAQTPTRNHAPRRHHKKYARKSLPNPQRHVVPTAVLTQFKLVPITAARPFTTAVPKFTVTRPRQAKTIVTKPNSPPRRHINRSPSPKASNFPPKVTAIKASMGNPQHALKDKGVIDSGCSRHMTWNMSYLFDFEELNSGYVAFGGNPKGDENLVLLKVPRENNMYNVDLKNIVPSGDLTCLFAKATLDESNLYIAKRKNRTLIEAARTMLADLLLPIPFLAEAVNTACYVQNGVLVTKPHNKTAYELLHGRTPSIGFMRPFGCLVTILNTLDSLGKFDGKVDEGFLLGNSVSIKAFRVFNSKTRIVQDTLHINFLENKPHVTSSGPTWLFDIDTLTKTMNYQPVTTGNQSNPSKGVQEQFDAEKAGEEIVQQYVLFPVWSSGFTNPHNTDGDAAFDKKEPEFEGRKPKSKVNVSPSSSAQSKNHDDKTKREAKGKTPVESLTGYRNLSAEFEDFSDNNINEDNAAELEDITYSDDENDVGAEADFNNLETSITVSHILTTRVHKDHHVIQIIGNLSSATQTMSMTRVAKDQGGLSQINNDDFHTCMFSCFLLQEEPKRVHQALKDPSWIEAMQEELLQFKVQKEEPKRIHQALKYPSWIEAMQEELLQFKIQKPSGFEDLYHPDKVYKVVNALYGLHQAPKAWYETVANYLLENGFQRGKIDQTLFIKMQKGDILLVQIYVDDIIFASTPIDTEKPLLKDPDEINTPRCDKDRLELIELTVFLLRSDEKVRIEVSVVDLQVSAVRLNVTAVSSSFCCLIIDFLNGSSIKYALTVNPNIYVSCIKQFRTSFDVKKVNEITRLQALVDKKRVIITKATIRDDLYLDDAEGIDCLPNKEIFTELARMGYEKPSTKLTFYNAFFSSRKFNFSKYIFDSLVRNVDSSTKFYMYPRFLQLMIRKQVGDLSSHTIKYSSLALIQKVFANMRRVGKGFSRVETPPFEGMIVEQQVGEGADEVHVDDVSADGVATEGASSVANNEVPAAVDEPSIPSPPPPTPPPTPSKERIKTSDDTIMDDVSNQERIIADMDADKDMTLKDVAAVAKDVQDAEIKENDKVEPAKLQEVVEVVTTAKLITKVVTAASAIITAATALTLTTTPSATRRRKGVVIRDPEEFATPSIIIHTEAKFKDKGKGIMKEDNVVKRFQALKRKPHTESQARNNMMIYLRNVVGFKMDYFKGMAYDDICPIFEKKFNSNMAFLQKIKEQMDEEDSRALKRLSETQEEKAAKKQNFLSLLRNFDQEGLEVLLELVKERFASSKPKNFPDDFLLTTLTYMFEKPNVQAQVWKSQKIVHGLAKVKSWRLLESCRVHIITFTSTQMILLVERRYPLSRFTLDQLINTIRLEVEEEAEVSLELLRFIRQQQQEGFRAE